MYEIVSVRATFISFEVRSMHWHFCYVLGTLFNFNRFLPILMTVMNIKSLEENNDDLRI